MRSQSETHALGVLLVAQQNRTAQLTARIDAVRAELIAASERAKDAADRLAWDLAHPRRTVDPAERGTVEAIIRQNQEESAKASAVEARLKLRETELVNALFAEDARWAELVSRLELLIKR